MLGFPLPIYEAKHGAQPVDPDPLKELGELLGKSRRDDAKIRCPKCRWKPRPEDRWSCLCGCSWNTFDTYGCCPKCRAEWNETQCLSCKEWSLHAEWYSDNERPQG
jgi:hypothetical protein